MCRAVVPVQSVQWTSKTVQSRGQGQHWRTEGTSDQVSSVGADIAALVVGVDSEVESHEFNKVFVLAEAEQIGEVVSVVLILLHCRDLAVLEDITIDSCSDGGKFGN